MAVFCGGGAGGRAETSERKERKNRKDDFGGLNATALTEKISTDMKGGVKRTLGNFAGGSGKSLLKRYVRKVKRCWDHSRLSGGKGRGRSNIAEKARQRGSFEMSVFHDSCFISKKVVKRKKKLTMCFKCRYQVTLKFCKVF